MRERVSVRILLVAPTGRLLLIKYEDARIAHSPIFWCTPGGGLDPGETVAEAARRELIEETGIADARLGPVVWLADPVINYFGETMRVHESYVVAHCNSEALSADGWTALEQRVIREMRWWTPAQIAASGEVIYPRRLADLVGEVVAGRYPAEPIRLDG